MNNKDLKFLSNVFSERINHWLSLIEQMKKLGLEYNYELGRYEESCFSSDLIEDLIHDCDKVVHAM